MDDTVRKLGEKIRELRLARQMTLQELGEKTGMAWEHIRRIETAKIPSPTIGSLEKLAEAFGVPITTLFEEPTKNPSEQEAIFLRQRGFDEETAKEIQELMDWFRQRQERRKAEKNEKQNW